MSFAQQELFGSAEVALEGHSSKADIFREVPTFPPFSEIENGDLFSLSLSSRAPNLTHGLHRFAAKYIPRIPAWVMDQFAQKGDVVLDPFCGSGTTLVEAVGKVRQSIGIDFDPLACLIATAKTAKINHARIEHLGHQLSRDWMRSPGQLCVPISGVDNFVHWFCPDAWGQLQTLLLAIDELDCTADERNFMLCVFSSILRYVSNADDQTQKTYVSGTLKKTPPAVAPTFWRAFAKAVAACKELETFRLPDSEVRMIRGDASEIELPPESVDLVITSPPYLDSVDYMYNFMLEYFWLGPRLGVPDRKTFNQMRRMPTGAKKPLSGVVAPGLPDSLSDLISEDEIPRSRVSATRTYCTQMAKHFNSIAKAMKRDSHYVLVIGNSKTGEGILPIHDSLIRLAADAGLSFQKAFAYRIRRHYMKFPRGGRGGIITMDWVIVLKKTRGPARYPDRLPLPDFTLRADEVAN